MQLMPGTASAMGVDDAAVLLRTDWNEKDANTVGGLVTAIMQLVLAVASVFVMGFIIDALAPTFGGQKGFNQAVKVAAYSYTPIWILSILAINLVADQLRDVLNPRLKR